MNRRDMIKRAALGATVVAIGGPSVLMMEGCKVKDIAFYVSTVTGSLQEVAPLLPGAAGLIAQAVAAANDFLSAYKAGKFDNAKTLFMSLSGFVGQILADVGASSPGVKLILALTAVAIRTIGTLLNNQPAVVAAKMKARSQVELSQVALLDRLTNSQSVDALFAAVQF